MHCITFLLPVLKKQSVKSKGLTVDLVDRLYEIVGLLGKEKYNLSSKTLVLSAYCYSKAGFSAEKKGIIMHIKW